MRGARGVLISLTGGHDLTLFEVDEAVNRIRKEVDDEANIIFGSSLDDTLNGRIRVSVVATGIDIPVVAPAPAATPAPPRWGGNPPPPAPPPPGAQPQPVMYREAAPAQPPRVVPLAETAGSIFKKATGLGSLWKRPVPPAPEPAYREPAASTAPRGPGRQAPHEETDIPAFLRRQSN